MKQNLKAYWQTLPGQGSCPVKHLGYVLFAGDDPEGRVLFSRVADPTLCRGESFFARMGLSGEEIAELRSALSAGETCLLISTLGVGVLSARYDLWAGFFVYIHIHEDPRSLRRILNHERLMPEDILPPPLGGLRVRACPTDEDIPVLNRLQVSMDYLASVKACFLSKAADDRVPLASLRALISAIAVLSGGELTFIAEDNTEAEALCPAPRMTEAMCVYWTLQMAALSLNGQVNCFVGTCGEGDAEVPIIQWATSVDRTLLSGATEESRRLLHDLDHMVYRGELNGIRAHLTACDGPDHCLLTVEMIFERNPAKDPPAGLKTHMKLIYHE